jgi:hypothetical protein
MASWRTAVTVGLRIISKFDAGIQPFQIKRNFSYKFLTVHIISPGYEFWRVCGIGHAMKFGSLRDMHLWRKFVKSLISRKAHPCVKPLDSNHEVSKSGCSSVRGLTSGPEAVLVFSLIVWAEEDRSSSNGSKKRPVVGDCGPYHQCKP